MRSHIVNVIDVEATCYERNEFPDGEAKDIIEVGLCMVDLATMTITKTLSIPVIPERSQVSPFCTALTGWTMAKLKRQGVSFAEACARLRNKYGAQNRLLVTDSSGDVELIRLQCEQLGLPNPLGPDHFNVATWFQLVTDDRKNIGLDAMLARFGLQFEGVRHRGWCDAANIARLFIELKKRTTLTPKEG